ncbi:hypothetical protein D9M69_677760 [compost metagenome]
MPASRFLNSGLSRILVKTAMVMSRSLYSSMSRLMNLGFGKDAALANSGVSFSTTCSTASSKAHGECGATVEETLMET